jgi:hypothetical protein
MSFPSIRAYRVLVVLIVVLTGSALSWSNNAYARQYSFQQFTWSGGSDVQMWPVSDGPCLLDGFSVGNTGTNVQSVNVYQSPVGGVQFWFLGSGRQNHVGTGEPNNSGTATCVNWPDVFQNGTPTWNSSDIATTIDPNYFICTLQGIQYNPVDVQLGMPAIFQVGNYPQTANTYATLGVAVSNNDAHLTEAAAGGCFYPGYFTYLWGIPNGDVGSPGNEPLYLLNWPWPDAPPLSVSADYYVCGFLSATTIVNYGYNGTQGMGAQLILGPEDIYTVHWTTGTETDVVCVYVPE